MSPGSIKVNRKNDICPTSVSLGGYCNYVRPNALARRPAWITFVFSTLAEFFSPRFPEGRPTIPRNEKIFPMSPQSIPGVRVKNGK
jgi:hypothetical protein